MFYFFDSTIFLWKGAFHIPSGIYRSAEHDTHNTRSIPNGTQWNEESKKYLIITASSACFTLKIETNQQIGTKINHFQSIHYLCLLVVPNLAVCCCRIFKFSRNLPVVHVIKQVRR